MKSCFDRGIRNFGDATINQRKLIEQDEMVLAAHGFGMGMAKATNPRCPRVDPYDAASIQHQVERCRAVPA